MTTIDATTTFYALTAPVKGYTLEDQVLGSLTLREWLCVYNGQDAAEDLVDWLLGTYGFYTDQDDALSELAFTPKRALWAKGIAEPFTAAELLNRLRLDAMEE